MATDLISKKTRIEFREILVGWSLREIGDLFAAAGVGWDRSHEPATGGQRRSFVEQHYFTLDFTDPACARRLVTVFENILATTEQRLPTLPDKAAGEHAVASLLGCLKSDGMKYELGKLVPTSPTARKIFAGDPSTRTISEITRRNIIDELRIWNVSWAGRLGEVEFLSRLYDLTALHSNDHRVDSFEGDICQHRYNNHDWPDDWVFTDSRIDLLHAKDAAFLDFLCLLIHPAVRSEQKDADALNAMFNKHLIADRWEIAESGQLSGKAVYSSRQRITAQVRLKPSPEPADVLSDEYVQELARKCDERLANRDFEGAITTGRTVLEAILVELEERLAGTRGDYKGDLPKQFKQVARLLKMDDKRPDLDDRFKDVIRGLVMVTNSLASLRNKISDGHARERKPAPHHARLVVNAAKTVASFLVESYAFQRAKGSLDGKPSSNKGTPNS
jgi:hypothetical protein